VAEVLSIDGNDSSERAEYVGSGSVDRGVVEKKGIIRIERRPYLLPACTYNEGGKRVKSRLRKDHLGLGGKRDRMRRAVEVDVELLG
jgi:hypothetical protein